MQIRCQDLSALTGAGGPRPIVTEAQHANARSRALSKLQERDPTIEEVRVSEVSGETLLSVEFRRRGSSTWESVGGLSYEITASGQKASIDVHMDPAWYGRGLNDFLMADFLRRFPSVSTLEGDLRLTNLAVMLVSSATGTRSTPDLVRLSSCWRSDSDYKREIANELIAQLEAAQGDPPTAAALRLRLIQAFVDATPAGRLRTRYGFGRLTNLTIELRPGGEISVYATTEAGSPNPDAIRIEVRDSRTRLGGPTFLLNPGPVVTTTDRAPGPAVPSSSRPTMVIPPTGENNPPFFYF